MRDESCEILKHRAAKIEARDCPHQAIVVHLFSSFHAFALLLMVHISHDKFGGRDISRRRRLHAALKPASLAPLRECLSAYSRSPILSVRRSCLRLSLWILHRTPFYRESEKQRLFTGPGGIASCTPAHRQFLQSWIQGTPRRLMLKKHWMLH